MLVGTTLLPLVRILLHSNSTSTNFIPSTKNLTRGIRTSEDCTVNNVGPNARPDRVNHETLPRIWGAPNDLNHVREEV